MAPRVRVALISLGVALIVIVVLYQMYAVVLSPLLQWRGERAEDRAAYQSISALLTRAEVERFLSGWEAERLEGTAYCQMLAKRQAPKSGNDVCTAADHEIAYQRQRTIKREAPLTPLRIIVVYDRNERVVTATTLD
ncbi:MAG: hypothetical protein V4671_03175 [Armatimonadota bacterium]